MASRILRVSICIVWAASLTLNTAAGSWNRDVAGEVWKKAPRTMARTTRTASQRTRRPMR